MMPSAVSLRVAAAGDTRALARLHRRVALTAYADIFPPEAPPPTLDSLSEDWSARLHDEANTAFVASLDDRIIGVVVAGPDVDGGGHLSRLYVEVDLWGRSTGRALHDAAVDHLAASGFSSASLWVLERNKRVRAWYERLGWQPTNERKPVYEPAGVLDVRYTRRL